MSDGERRGSSLTKPSRTLPIVAAVLALTVGLVVAGTRDDGPGPGEAIVEVDGLARVVDAEGEAREVSGRTRLGPGDRFTLERGTARFELADEVRYEALGPSGDEAGTEVEMALQPRLRTGRLLVSAPSGTTVRSGSGTVSLGVGSVARVTQTLAARVDVFRGRAELATAGLAEPVGPLRSAEVVAEGEIGRTRPLAYVDTDPWDRRHLAPALALDRSLGPLVAGLRTARVDPVALTERVRGQVDAPAAAELAPMLAARRGGLDGVVALAVVGSGERGDFDDRWARGVRFHDAGAPWGLVAMDLRADPDAVVDALTGAVDEGGTAPTGGEELAGAVPDPDAPAATPTDGTATEPAAGTEDGTDAGPGTEVLDGTETGVSPSTPAPVVTVPGTGTPITSPPVTVPSAPLPPVTVPVVTTVVDALDDVTGGVVTDLTDTVGGVLAPVTGPLTGGGGLLGGVTGTGGLLGGVTGSGGLLPLEP